MPQYKFTAQRGKPTLAGVAVAAGSAEAQSDTMSLNIDVTKLTKGEALTMLKNIEDKIHASKWPPL